MVSLLQVQQNISSQSFRKINNFKAISFGLNTNSKNKTQDDKDFSTIPEELRINLPVSIKVSDVQRIISTALEGNEIKVNKVIKLSINNTQVQTDKGNLVICSDFKIPGPIPVLDIVGKVKLTGKPVFDNDSKAIKFNLKNIVFSTNNPAINVADFWFHDLLVSKISSKLSFGIDSILNEIKKNLNDFLKSSDTMGLNIDSNIDTLIIRNIIVSEDKVKANLSIGGLLRFFSSFENFDKLINRVKNSSN